MMKKNYIILKNIFDIFVFVNSYLFTIKTVTKSCFTIKLDNYRGNRITKKIINVRIMKNVRRIIYIYVYIKQDMYLLMSFA